MSCRLQLFDIQICKVSKDSGIQLQPVFCPHIHSYLNIDTVNLCDKLNTALAELKPKHVRILGTGILLL